MRYGRSGKGRGSHADNSFWICFSDLMSALMLVFVLVMFYSVYQYFNMLEDKTAELLRQSGLLDQQQAQLTLSQQELKEKEEQLNAQSAQLDEQSAQLAAQSEQLEEQSAKLSEAESEMLAQQAQMLLQEKALEALQSRLDDQQTKLDRLVGVRAAIIEDLVGALKASNITGANVDVSGAIVFDSELMFEVGKSTLNNTGKDFLNRFLPNYLHVLMSDEYSRYVSQIIIEGHTDTRGSFIDNAKLSQDRALEVLRYIMSDEFTGITAADKERLESLVTTNGRSYSDPVRNADGSINLPASRRVVIKFRLNDEDMVTEMLDVLKNMQ